MTSADETEGLNERVAALMPELIDQLKQLVEIPSIAFPGFDPAPVLQAAEVTQRLFTAAGATASQLVDVPDGPPAVFAEFAGPPDAPTVLLYAHYDVQPAPASQGWSTDPWKPTEKEDGRIYGRGAADDKSGIVTHLGAIRCIGHPLPVNVRVLIEGSEEHGGHLVDLIAQRPELVQCDAFVIADSGNSEVGIPALTATLRGFASCSVTVRTLENAVHSGLFGGAAPDALIALVRMLATLHDDRGNVAVKGLHEFEWDGAGVEEERLRADAGMLSAVETVGSGTIASRLWSKPSVNVIGLDAPSTAGASNVLLAQARATVSMRVAPGADEKGEQQILMDHLRRAAPWNVDVDVQPIETGAPFSADLSGEMVDHARQALEQAFGRSVETIGVGGSIPLVAAVQQACPSTEVIIWGAEDRAAARIHGPNESVDPAEIERMIVAEALFLQRLGKIRP